jgi:hypothetical protein
LVLLPTIAPDAIDIRKFSATVHDFSGTIMHATVAESLH